MIFVIQRVSEARVDIEGECRGKIGKGFMTLIGVADTDTKEIADKMVRKMCNMRIFEDENGKTNLSLADVDGLAQWTGDCSSSPSLRSTPTARRATGLPLSVPARRIWPTRCTNTSSSRRRPIAPGWKEGSSAPT